MKRTWIVAAVMLSAVSCGGHRDTATTTTTTGPDTVLLITRAACQENVALAAMNGTWSGSTLDDLTRGTRRIADHAVGGDPEIQRLAEAVAHDFEVRDMSAFSSDGIKLTIACMQFE